MYEQVMGPNSKSSHAMITATSILLTIIVSITIIDASGKSHKLPSFTPLTSEITSTLQLPRERRKPNIVLILTDDQDVELGSLNFMPKTLRTIRDHGVQFRHAYVTTPMCCPSRSSLLTGMYVHNHQVYTNNDNCSSTQWQATHETRSFATYLSNAGYRTGYFGKYLNKYNGSYIPPGWREWGGLIMNSKYYNYSINMNGKKIKHGFDYYKDYYSDLIANDSIAFLRQSKKNNANKPVMLTMSFPAPHGPEDSAPQYSHLFFNVTTHHTPSYDYAPNPDKQWILQVTKKMQPIHKQFTDLLMTKRLQTLQSVDNAVQLVVNELETLGELDNTFVIYTSDHGYHLGQFGLIKGKSFPFEFDVRVPFLVRGPGVEPGTVVDDIVLNIDLAPTFLDIAGVDIPPHMDGKSVLPLFLNSKRKPLKWTDTFLIESSGRRETPYLDAKLKIRQLTSTEVPLINEKPLDENEERNFENSTVASVQKNYDSIEDLSVIDDDDDEEENIDEELEDDLEDELTRKITKVDDLIDIPLSDINPLPTNKLERIAAECQRNELRLPCRLNQKWYCANENGRWRKHKCKLYESALMNNINKSFRKCACFTSIGLVYRRIPLQNVTKRHTKMNRMRRDADLNSILFDGNLNPTTRREKRNTLAHIENVMDDVQGKLRGLETVNSSLNINGIKPDLETNKISETTAGCVVFDKGIINCSRQIYYDRKTWRQSRHQIDNEIHQLKQKLEKLKEIRRHLKHTKPEFTDNNNNNETHLNLPNELSFYEDLIIDDNEQITVNNNNNKKRRKRPNFGDSRPNRKHGNYSDLEQNETTLNYGSTRRNFQYLTTSSTIEHTNPHRHNHFLPTTTNFDVDSSTENTPVNRRIITSVPKSKKDNLIPYPKNNYCHCEAEEPYESLNERRTAVKETRRRIKEEKLRRKLKKQRKKDQLEKECLLERMNCFHHDNEHWKTAPLWTEGPFCFCMNANNNTYSCIRTINSTHNFLYCEFTTGLVTFYNLRKDPFELQNRIDQLKSEERSYLHDLLKILIACKGRSCNINHHSSPRMKPNILPVYAPNSQFNRLRKKKSDQFGNGHLNGKHKNGIRQKNRNNTTVAMNILKKAMLRRRRRT